MPVRRGDRKGETFTTAHNTAPALDRQRPSEARRVARYKDTQRAFEQAEVKRAGKAVIISVALAIIFGTCAATTQNTPRAEGSIDSSSIATQFAFLGKAGAALGFAGVSSHYAWKVISGTYFNRIRRRESDPGIGGPA